jgi:hypothetical protein
MSLPDSDLIYLQERQLAYEVVDESGMTCVVISDFDLPAGYDKPAANLLLRLPAGYPDLAPDMWWFEPAVRTDDGRVIPATEVIEQHLGRTWQRWSRHFQPGQWQSGTDGLESYVALIRREIQQNMPEVAR